MGKTAKSGFPELAGCPMLEDRFLARLRCFATRWLGNAEAGEDAAQEALRRMLEAVAEGRVRQKVALPAFAYQTVRHVCLHYRRSAKREQRALARYGAEPLLDDPGPGPLQELVSDERKAEVQGALAAMDEEDRQLLIALYVQEQSPRELAATLKLSDGALRTRKHRALKCLGQRLAESGAVTADDERALIKT